MARTNKYTSINFNHVLEKNVTSSSTPNNPKSYQNHPSYSSISAAANAKSNGRMLVLTRPSPKPIPTLPLVSPTPSKQSQPPSPSVPDQAPVSCSDPDQISLRPLGQTGSGLTIPGQEREKEVVPVSKSDRFVPPHLRPGFVGREERLEAQVSRGKEQGQKYFGSPGRYVENGRPKSGGYEKMRRGGESDLGFIGRLKSSGNRPTSSG